MFDNRQAHGYLLPPLEITEVHIRLVGAGEGNRLLAFANITLEQKLVVRGLRLILGETGKFVSMPSRKRTDHCHRCDEKNPLRACFCSQCGQKLDPRRAILKENGRVKFYEDIAHPINVEFRERIESAVLAAYLAAVRNQIEDALVSFSGGQVEICPWEEEDDGSDL